MAEHAAAPTRASEQRLTGGSPEHHPEGVGNPFPGPKPYRRGQEGLFFGRGNEIEELTSLVLSTSAVLVYAQSGSGKSSLLQAGLVPSLVDFGFRVLPTVRFGRASPSGAAEEADRPRSNPYTEQVCDIVAPDGVLPGDECDLKQLAASLNRNGEDRSTLLVLDQLEELFADPALWQERADFMAQLRDALDANPWLRAVVGIRSDYLANLLPHERDLPGRVLIRYRLESLREQAARAAIEQAFAASGIPLTPKETKLVLDRLLNLDMVMPGSQFRSQYVNLIQLQILCRRLWEEKAKARSLRGPDTSSDSLAILQESDVDLADSMRSFVDGAITTVVAETHSDEGIVRRWLEDRLMTPSGRRAVLLADNEQTTGLPVELLDAMEDARLVQVEQRNQSRYAELTHDSMLAAVQASNTAWFSARRQARRRLVAGSLLALALLLGLFALLRDPPEETLLSQVDGVAGGSPVEIPLPRTQPGRIAQVQIQLTGESYGTTVRIIARDDGKREEQEVVKQTVPTFEGTKVKTTLGFVVDTSRLASQKVVLEANETAPISSNLKYVLSVYSAPVILKGTTTRAEVSSAYAAVRLVQGEPVILQVGPPTLRTVFGARVLYKDNARVVMEAPGKETYAVLSMGVDDEDLTYGTVTKSRVVTVPAPGFSAGGHIERTDAAIILAQAERGRSPFAVEASCTDHASIEVLDSVGHSIVTAGGAKSASIGAENPSALVPATESGQIRAVLVSSAFNPPLDCDLRMHSFHAQRIDSSSKRTVTIEADRTYNAYTVRLPVASAMIVHGLGGASAALECPSRSVVRSDSKRLLAFVPANRDCVLSINRSNSIGRPVSYPMHIFPIPRR